MSANKTEIFQDSPSSGEFKQCSNGHYYQGSSCPYCRGNNGTSGPTIDDGALDTGRTTIPHGGGYRPNPTTDMIQSTVSNSKPSSNVHGGTEFGDEGVTTVVSGSNPNYLTVRPVSRSSRKLVGWLVSYSNDPLGVDYKLFEGRNIIGRDIDCNVSVNDGRVSAKHAVLLYRAGKYSITDTQSSHGTFVNDEDIELEPRYINDGDIIRIGNTVFKFRTSL